MDNQLDQLGEQIAEQAAHLDAAMHRLLANLREFDERGGWHTQGAASCAHWLAWRVGWDLVTAREHVRVARKLAEFHSIDDSLRRGEVSYSKVRAILRVATPENELLLLEYAKLMTASQLENLARKYALVQRHGQDPNPRDDEQRRYVRRRDTEDGMVKIEAVLHPEEAEMVWTMLNQTAAQLPREPSPSVASDSAECVHLPSTPTLPSPPSSPWSRPQAPPPGTASVRHSDPTPIPDSAESLHPSSAPTTTGTASAHHRDPAPIPDSAESLHPSSADTRTSAQTTKTTLPAHLCPIPIPDSAESLHPSSAPTTTTDAASTHHRDSAAIRDSAESLALASVGTQTSAQTTKTTLPAHLCPTPIPNSAESTTAPAPTSDSAESDGCDTIPAVAASQAPKQSLLDRLLDEADALQAAETLPAVLETSSSERPVETAPDRVHRRTDAARRADATRRAFNRADALVSLAQASLRGDRPNRTPVEIVLTIPESSLRAMDADPVEVGEMGDSFVSGQTARRLACDAGVIEVVENDHGVPISVGRKRRTIEGALKRALHRRDRMCTFPSCTNRIFLEGHHIKHWVDGGETNLANSALLCTLHHRYVHEYGFAIELGPDQRPRFRDPHGRPIAAVPERLETATLGWPQIRAANAPLGISADTIAGPWDGTPVDYGRIVGHLVAVDGLG